MNNTVAGMKSVMIFDAKDSDEQTLSKLNEWWSYNKISALADRNVPNADETRKMLHAR